MKARFADHPLFQFARLVQYKFGEVRVMQTAGALTYTTLLSLVPMLTVVLLVMRQFSPFMKLGEGMRGFLLQNLLPEKAGKVVATYALQFSEKASSLTIVGTVFLVVTAIMLFATIDRTISSIWLIRRPRPWYVRIPIYWLALTLGPVIFAVGVAATGDLMHASLGMMDNPAGWLRKFADRAATALLLSALFVFLFHVVPNRRLKFWHGLAGGLVAGVGVVLVQRLFGFYLAKLPNFTLIYGTFSVLPIFLIWVYLSWLVILLGATVAAVLPAFGMRSRLLPLSPAGRVVAVMRLAQALVAAQDIGQAAEVDQLAAACRMTPGQTEQMLEDMRLAGWTVRTEDGAWMLCVAGEALQLGELISCLVIGVQRSEVLDARFSAADRALLDCSLGELRTTLARPVGRLSAPGAG
ncbi:MULTISPECIES: YihY family inner membrane protein [unclassified Uliginosibacterium]|uniref:YihY family inner membrane protein n=1 Tax=unclassified Uliginosibacterium TaxID=2621521 RepID=UPI00130469F7|nr:MULTISPECIES: YihY family inner membrane protein [unclassified Uliginosibacterium]MDO6387431.1 YihY family inner membrane protein [Uliginosibacterium sp. 31-12]